MKSTYTDNYRHAVIFVPPVYNKTTKGKNGKRVTTQHQAPIITLKVSDDAREIAAYAADAEKRYATRPGKIVIRKADQALPHVGRNYKGRLMLRNAEAA